MAHQDTSQDSEVAALALGSIPSLPGHGEHGAPGPTWLSLSVPEAGVHLRKQVSCMKREQSPIPSAVATGGMSKDLLQVRTDIIKWFDGCAEHYEWADTTASLALSSWDRYLLATYDRPMATGVLRLAAYVAALVASKMEEPEDKALNMERMKEVVCPNPRTGSALYTPEQVRTMELSLLRELSFVTSPPLPEDMAALLARLLPPADAVAAVSITAAATAHLLTMRFHPAWLCNDSLTVAAAAVACALVGKRRQRAIASMLRIAEAALGRAISVSAVTECAAIILGPCGAAIFAPGGRSSPTGVEGVQQVEKEAWVSRPLAKVAAAADSPAAVADTGALDASPVPMASSGDGARAVSAQGVAAAEPAVPCEARKGCEGVTSGSKRVAEDGGGSGGIKGPPALKRTLATSAGSCFVQASAFQSAGGGAGMSVKRARVLGGKVAAGAANGGCNGSKSGGGVADAFRSLTQEEA